MIHIFNEDNLSRIKKMKDAVVDSVVTDPPYGINFMGASWDISVPTVDFWKEVYRVMKPGAYLISFFGDKTYHAGATAIVDAGFVPRSMLIWAYGNGMPKGKDIGKATGDPKWDDWHTALKPAIEPMLLAQKPLSENTVVDNIKRHGVGALNIGATRIEYVNEQDKQDSMSVNRTLIGNIKNTGKYKRNEEHNFEKLPHQPKDAGRFTSNLLLDDSQEIQGMFPDSKPSTHRITQSQTSDLKGDGGWSDRVMVVRTYGDVGSASRFFYIAKPTKEERNRGIKDHYIKQLNIVIEYQGRQIEWIKVMSRNKAKQSVEKILKTISESTALGEKVLPENMLLYMNYIMDQYLKDTISTTKILTQRIMISKIYKWLLGWNTDEYTLALTHAIEMGTLQNIVATVSSGCQLQILTSDQERTQMVISHGAKDATLSIVVNASVISGNVHLTVKPLNLMRQLVKLVTPINGVCLDPYMGSGTTGMACKLEGMHFIGIELDESSFAIASERIDGVGAVDIETNYPTPPPQETLF